MRDGRNNRSRVIRKQERKAIHDADAKGNAMTHPLSVFRTMIRTGALLVTACVLLPVARAAAADGPPLPPEAYAACDSKREGDACSVQFREHEIHGTCAPAEGSGKLFCRPSDLPPLPKEERR
jgi:hypothetical protein